MEVTERTHFLDVKQRWGGATVPFLCCKVAKDAYIAARRAHRRHHAHAAHRRRAQEAWWATLEHARTQHTGGGQGRRGGQRGRGDWHGRRLRLRLRLRPSAATTAAPEAPEAVAEHALRQATMTTRTWRGGEGGQASGGEESGWGEGHTSRSDGSTAVMCGTRGARGAERAWDHSKTRTWQGGQVNDGGEEGGEEGGRVEGSELRKLRLRAALRM